MSKRKPRKATPPANRNELAVELHDDRWHQRVNRGEKIKRMRNRVRDKHAWLDEET
jgi:hypothetical protein